MSAYFLLGKSWNAVALRLAENTDAPGKLTDHEASEATVALCQVYERYKFIQDFIRGTDGSCNASSFELAFITVSPPATVDLRSFRSQVEDFLRKTKCIRRWYMAYEQRGTVGDPESLGRGLHAHILCDVARPTTFANFKRACYTAFRGWYLDVRPKLYDWEAGKVKYLLGEKKSDKLELVEGDRAWRITVGLDPVYSKNWERSPDLPD